MKKNRILCLVLGLITLFCMMSLTALPALALDAYPYPGNYDPPEGYYRICHVSDGKYLAAIKTADGIRYSPQDRGDIFKIEKVKMSDTPGVYAFKILVAESNATSRGVCLKVYGNLGYPPDKIEITDAYGLGTWFERWAFDKDENGNVYIRSYLDNKNNTTPDETGKDGGAVGVHPCLDISPDTTDHRTCTWHKDTDRAGQLWKLEKVESFVPGTVTGEGTAEKPYEISNSNQLSRIADLVTDGLDYAGVHFRLLGSFSYSGSPIGSENHPFCGTFDGGGNTITASIDGGSNNSVGLFSHLSGAVVKNLEVAGSVKGAGSVGAIAGNAEKSTVIDNCHVTAEISGTDGNVGGIAGAMDTGTVSNCRMDGFISSGGWTSCGGIVGGFLNGGTIINCVSTGKVTGEKAVGGILGCVLYGDPVIVNCASLGSTAVSEKGGSEHGGMVGFIGKGVHSMTMKGCFTCCTIGASTDSGYVIGKREDADPINCENVFYIPSGSSFDTEKIVGVGEQLDLKINGKIMPTEYGTKLEVTRNRLNSYREGKTEAGVAFSPWEQEQNTISPKSFQKTGNATASTLSDGNPWIVLAGAVILIGGMAAAIVFSKKRKKAC